MKEKLIKAYDLLFKKEISILSGNLAYSFFLAIIPILSLLFYFLTSFNISMDIIENFLTETFPKDVANFLQPVFTNNITPNTFITLCLSVFVITNGCNTIIATSNTIFNIESSNILKRFIKALILAIMLIILFAFVIIVPLLGKSIINLIGTFTDLVETYRSFIDTVYALFQIPISLLVMFFIIKLLYTIAPDEKVSSKYMNRGAFFTTISWLIVTIIYSYYINNIARYDLVYGNLANIVILLFWFYVLAYIFVVGMYMNKNTQDTGIEKTNTMKLDEIRKKMKETNSKKK